MDIKEYAALDATAVAEKVRRREVSAAEVHGAACAAMAAINPLLNAVIGETPTEAERALHALDTDAPLAGVPFLIKDVGMTMEGVESQLASRFFEGFVAPADTELAARFKAAGVVTIGRSNTPECGCAVTTEPVLYGPTRNPWNADLSPGGSSGGAAAAVAAGIVPIAHANDGGGSIRIPAAACGLVGLKPSRGRQPVGPHMGEFLFGMGAELVVSRTVRDTAAVMDATDAPDWGARAMAPLPPEPYGQAIGRQPRRLRIAFTASSEDFAVHPHHQHAVRQTALWCEQLGHYMVEASPDIAMLEGFLLWIEMSSVFGCELTGMAEALLQRQAGPHNMEAIVWRIVENGRHMSAATWAVAFSHMNHVSRVMADFHDTYDVWLTPTTLQPPMPLGTFKTDDPDISLDDHAKQMTAYGGWQALYNVSGQPGLSLPLVQSPDGLPVGVHFGARYGDEATLLQLAAQLEKAQPWHQRRPSVHVASGQL